MSAHTPGPWTVRQRRTTAPHDFEIEDGCPEQHGLAYVRMHNGEQEANAYLIAAASDMAALLLSAYQHVSHGGPTLEEVADVLRKAGLLK